MTQKLTPQHYIDIAKERNLKVIDMSGYTTVHKSKICLFCLNCNTQFVTSCQSFLNARKTGCPTCKKTSISASNKSRILPKRKKAKPKVLAPEFDQIKCIYSLKEFLQKNPNPYNNFILSVLDRHTIPNPDNLVVQQHHIIPKHCGGPDVDWNLVKLTVEEHHQAHLLRWETFKNPSDQLALKGMQKTHHTKEMQTSRIELSHKKQKEAKVGFHDPEQQRISGRKGGTKQRPAKIEKYKERLSLEVKNFLKEGSTWVHKTTQSKITFAPGELSLVTELRLKLISALPQGEHKEKLLAAQQTTVTSALAKVIKKQRPTVHSWGILQEMTSSNINLDV